MKPKTCKQCGKIFTPSNSLIPYCTYKCKDRHDIEKRKAEREKKKLSPRVLKKELWTLFSEFIRRRDADEWGYSTCVTCGVRKQWKEMQAGHFIPAGSSNYLRFHENNVHTQCYSCNVCKHSNPIEYRLWMEKKYGSQFVNHLISQRNNLEKSDTSKLLELITKYKLLLAKV